jgi:superfamily II DNA/RNA helicase
MSTTALKFGDLDPRLTVESLQAVESFGFVQMTPVQASTIPLFLTNKVLGLILMHVTS